MNNRQYFGTDGIRGKVGSAVMNPEFILKLGYAFGKVLCSEGSRKVIIGKDTRVSGYMLESSLEAGLSAAGVDVRLLGPMPTPAIAYLTQTKTTVLNFSSPMVVNYLMKWNWQSKKK